MGEITSMHAQVGEHVALHTPVCYAVPAGSAGTPGGQGGGIGAPMQGLRVELGPGVDAEVVLGLGQGQLVVVMGGGGGGAQQQGEQQQGEQQQQEQQAKRQRLGDGEEGVQEPPPLPGLKERCMWGTIAEVNAIAEMRVRQVYW